MTPSAAEMPYSPWDMPQRMLRCDGSMTCQMWLPTTPHMTVEVQWGPYGFQHTPVSHQNPQSDRDCRACRYIIKQATQARLTHRNFKLDVMDLFTIQLTQTGELRMNSR